MRRQRRRPMHYTSHSLHDGTILAAYPVRKPVPKTIKRDKIRIDEDGVCNDYTGAGRELSDVHNESRMRFQNIIATRLNTRRAIREIVLPYFEKLQRDVNEIRCQLDHIQGSLSGQRDTTQASESDSHNS
jgi:hypothetical protein